MNTTSVVNSDKKIIDKINAYFLSKILSDKNNIWKKLYLFRKVFLIKYFRHYFSQFGEDVILRDWIAKEFKNGFYVDVGCYHPRKFSNTYFLYKRGWRGINIDLDPIKIQAFELARPDDCNINAAVSDSEKPVKIFFDGLYSLCSTIDEAIAQQDPNFSRILEVQSHTLNNIIEKTPYAKRQIDLLTIDAEGHDFNVLKSLNLEVYKPKLIIIESHLRDIEKILASDIAVFLKNKGYQLRNWVGYSLFFALPNNGLLKHDKQV